MSTRGLAILALLAALAVGAVVLTRGPATDPASETAEAGQAFVPGLETRINEVERVRVRGAGGTLIADLRRGEGGWIVENRAGYPANQRTLRATLIGIARARRLEPKTDRPGRYASLGVAPIEQAEGDAVEVRLEGIDPPVTVLVGKRAAGDVSGTYLRAADARQAWLVSTDIERHHRIGAWLDNPLVDIPAFRVRTARIDARDGRPVRMNRPEPSARFDLDVPEGRRALSGSIGKSLARIVTDLRADDVRPAGEARDLPRLARAEFTTFGGLVVTLETFAAGRAESDPHHVRIRAATTEDAGDAARERARRLEARHAGWVYELPQFKRVNATQTLEGVLE